MNQLRILIFFLLFVPSLTHAQTRTMEYFINQSIQNDPKFSEIENLILSNRIDSQLVVAANKFQFTGNGNAYYAPVIKGYGYDAAITNGQQVSALVALNKQIYNKRNLSLQFKNLQLKTDSLNNSTLLYRQDLKKAIISQYIQTYSDQLQLNFNDQLVELLSKEERILKILTEKNIYKQADYLSFLVTLQQQQLNRSQLFVQYKNNYATLNYLAGIMDTTTQTLSEPALKMLVFNQVTPSPFLRNFQIDSLRLKNDRLAAEIQYRPKVNLFADAGYQSTLMITPLKNFGYNVGLNLTIPIYDGNQKRLQISKLDIQERTRLNQRDYFFRQYQQQIMLLQQQLHELENLADPINKQITYLETLINVNGKLLETGDIRMTDYILALNNYITAKNLLVQNQIAKYQVIQQLNYWNMNL
jgi:outer membrane protein TolC